MATYATSYSEGNFKDELLSLFEETFEPYGVIAYYVKKLAKKLANEILDKLKLYIEALYSGKEVRVIVDKVYGPQRVTYIGVCKSEPLEGETCWELDGEQYWNRVKQEWNLVINKALYEMTKNAPFIEEIFARVVNGVFLHEQAKGDMEIKPSEIYPYFSRELAKEIDNNFVGSDEWYELQSEQPYIIDTIRNSASIKDFVLKTFAYEVLKSKYPNITPEDIVEVECLNNKIVVTFTERGTGETKEETLSGSCYVEYISPQGIPKSAHEEYIFKML